MVSASALLFYADPLPEAVYTAGQACYRLIGYPHVIYSEPGVPAYEVDFQQAWRDLIVVDPHMDDSTYKWATGIGYTLEHPTRDGLAVLHEAIALEVVKTGRAVFSAAGVLRESMGQGGDDEELSRLVYGCQTMMDNLGLLWWWLPRVREARQPSPG